MISALLGKKMMNIVFVAMDWIEKNPSRSLVLYGKMQVCKKNFPQIPS